ncbi:helix-turn-helix domain-containing protein [Rariglobus hedericola]|uniref:Helix-turn-helix transcriptional regulator n=1 Tax=Rariglobus hedericola TaxID=2597822 RepID=A0A556QSM6_9BACT|nr:AraC family transcriptional regulator [Rariglobus hedericola]TSJ79645.1 helix-turn-helix transcriptional regulator [Rariglobus hedericola]
MPPAASAPSTLTFEDWSFLHTRLLWCYEGEVDAPNQHRFSQRNQLSAWWIQAGAVTVKRGRDTWTARAGEWMFCGPHPLHQNFSPGARILSINFKLEWPSGDSLVEQIVVASAAGHPALGKAARSLLRFISRCFPGIVTALQPQSVKLTDFFETQQLFAAWTQAYLKTVLAAGVVPARMGGLDPRVLEALRHLDRHDWRTPFREKNLAATAGLSAGHLDRLFVQQLGLTPRAYLQKRRLESATATLADSAVPAKKIAYDLGFSSASHFSHWLRRATGKSPRQVRIGTT